MINSSYLAEKLWQQREEQFRLQFRHAAGVRNAAQDPHETRRGALRVLAGISAVLRRI